MKENKKGKVLLDMILNIVSTAIPTISLQLCILPSIAHYINDNKYGLIVTILAMLNAISASIGTALNNVRLIYEGNYNSKKLKGDFQILLLIYELINILVVFMLSFYYIGVSNILDILLIIIIGILLLGREYYIVAFRIILDYKAILLNNVILVIGYIVGYFLFKLTGYWQTIYIFGLLASYIYIYKNSSICKEPLVKTELWSKISKDSILLIIASFLGRLTNYADKLLLYPLLGGAMVSVYYVATIFGKVVSMAITPINSVALSYLSKIKNKPNHLFKWSYGIGIIVCSIGYIFSVFFSRPILSIIYPKYVDSAMQYIYITSATICINVLTSIITPFVLKFFAMRWQIIINAITTVGYIAISLILLNYWGMIGFCIGALIANIIKLLTTTFIYIFKNDA